MDIQVKVEGIGQVIAKEDSSLLDLSKEIYKDKYKKYLGARIDNQIYNLYKKVEDGMEIRFLDNRDVDGYRIYTRTISAIFIMACKELYPEAQVNIEHFIGPGLYVSYIGPIPLGLSNYRNRKEDVGDNKGRL